ncbi:MAG: phosphoribosylglycinamide formyltransferase [Glaciecola sp.]|jgi:phosphoribosylglycinamide formyltransferase-1|nr:phosphoribosylglycinamide formyltransferase [Glaciecola sp.]MDG1814731.1 phosphoribosylglycinamide formyltransferase [Glaciecola sp.]MDG2100425.1 phosphoribosylglycinamide formyltransferase [Glaciecola sp.]
MKRIVVMISGSGSNLQTIIDQVHRSQDAAQIVCVISNKPDAYGLERAKDADIPNICVDSLAAATDRAAYDKQLIATIEEYQPDLIVLAGFMRILSDEFVNQYLGRLINIHPSLLPKYKGLNTHQRAIDNGDTEHGVSVHFVTPELDGGPVILQAKVPIFPEDSADDIAQRVQVQEHQIYPLVVRWFIQNRLIMNDGRAYMDQQVLGNNGFAHEE